MEPSPPKTQKSRKHTSRPFYEVSKKTSAEIVSEARSSVRALETTRPYTPAESNRTLFSKPGKKRDERPPSAFRYSKFWSIAKNNHCNGEIFQIYLLFIGLSSVVTLDFTSNDHKDPGMVRIHLEIVFF